MLRKKRTKATKEPKKCRCAECPAIPPPGAFKNEPVMVLKNSDEVRNVIEERNTHISKLDDHCPKTPMAIKEQEANRKVSQKNNDKPSTPTKQEPTTKNREKDNATKAKNVTMWDKFWTFGESKKQVLNETRKEYILIGQDDPGFGQPSRSVYNIDACNATAEVSANRHEQPVASSENIPGGRRMCISQNNIPGLSAKALSTEIAYVHYIQPEGPIELMHAVITGFVDDIRSHHFKVNKPEKENHRRFFGNIIALVNSWLTSNRMKSAPKNSDLPWLHILKELLREYSCYQKGSPEEKQLFMSLLNALQNFRNWLEAFPKCKVPDVNQQTTFAVYKPPETTTDTEPGQGQTQFGTHKLKGSKLPIPVKPKDDNENKPISRNKWWPFRNKATNKEKDVKTVKQKTDNADVLNHAAKKYVVGTTTAKQSTRAVNALRINTANPTPPKLKEKVNPKARGTPPEKPTGKNEHHREPSKIGQFFRRKLMPSRSQTGNELTQKKTGTVTPSDHLRQKEVVNHQIKPTMPADSTRSRISPRIEVKIVKARNRQQNVNGEKPRTTSGDCAGSNEAPSKAPSPVYLALDHLKMTAQQKKFAKEQVTKYLTSYFARVLMYIERPTVEQRSEPNYSEKRSAYIEALRRHVTEKYEQIITDVKSLRTNQPSTPKKDPSSPSGSVRLIQRSGSDIRGTSHQNQVTQQRKSHDQTVPVPGHVTAPPSDRPCVCDHCLGKDHVCGATHAIPRTAGHETNTDTVQEVTPQKKKRKRRPGQGSKSHLPDAAADTDLDETTHVTPTLETSVLKEKVPIEVANMSTCKDPQLVADVSTQPIVREQDIDVALKTDDAAKNAVNENAAETTTIVGPVTAPASPFREYLKSENTLNYSDMSVTPGHGDRVNKKKMADNVKKKVKTKGTPNKHLRALHFTDDYGGYGDGTSAGNESPKCEKMSEAREESEVVLSPLKSTAVVVPDFEHVVRDDREFNMVPEDIIRKESANRLKDLEELYAVKTTAKPDRKDRRQKKKDNKKGRTLHLTDIHRI